MKRFKRKKTRWVGHVVCERRRSIINKIRKFDGNRTRNRSRWKKILNKCLKERQ
jgi:hypothetical protein